MKKSTKGEAVLSACQIQATRLNQVEYRRFQRNVNLMHDDLKAHLLRLQRQAQSIRYHYTNVVRVVKPNPSHQLWKKVHAYEIAQDNKENWLERVKLRQRSKSKTHQEVLSSEPVRPLLVLLNNHVEKSIESIINLNENFLRPTTSPVKNHLSGQQRKSPFLTMFNEHSAHSNRSQQSESNTSSFLPSMTSSNSRKFDQIKLLTTMNTKNTSNLDTLYRIALQNQTAYKSVEQKRIEKRKLLDKEFATQHRALKGTIRSAELVK